MRNICLNYLCNLIYLAVKTTRRTFRLKSNKNQYIVTKSNYHHYGTFTPTHSTIIWSFPKQLSINFFISINYYFWNLQAKVWPSTSNPPVSSYSTEEERTKLVDYLQVGYWAKQSSNLPSTLPTRTPSLHTSSLRTHTFLTHTHLPYAHTPSLLALVANTLLPHT
jgi:hypothetical protein